MKPAGFVFLCSDITEAECLEKSLFGGMEKYQGRVKGLEKGAVVYLYNYNSKKLHGIFEAETNLQKNIVPEAWNGDFPWQVSVKRVETHEPITREDIGTLLKFFNGRPTSRLTQETVDALNALFRGEKRVIQYDDGNRYVCKDGHRVKSHPEQIICDWLYEHRIVHAYEREIPMAKRCDFYIPISDTDGIYIEYWGMTDKQYLKNKEYKTEIYKKHNLKLLEIEHASTSDIESLLSERLLPKV